MQGKSPKWNGRLNRKANFSSSVGLVLIMADGVDGSCPQDLIQYSQCRLDAVQDAREARGQLYDSPEGGRVGA